MRVTNMAALVKLFRVFVVIWNILFLTTALVLFGVGIFLRFGDGVIDSSLDGVMSSLEKTLYDSGFGDVDINVDWSSVFFQISLSFIFFGLGIAAITIFGCCGACYKVKCFLICYTVVCVILWVGQTVMVGIIYGSQNTLQEPFKRKLRNGIQSEYAGLNGTNLVSQGWNVVMQKMKCCGIDSYEDFTGAPNWAINYTSNSPSVTLMTPLACCKTLPSSEDFTCAGINASSSDNYLNQGCFDKVWEMIFGEMTVIVFGALGTLQLLLIVFTIVIVCSDERAPENKVAPSDASDTVNESSEMRRPELMFRETAWKDSKGVDVKYEKATFKTWTPVESLSF